MASLKQDLLEVDVYPEKNSKISFVQTHISMVFIGDEYVYKVKKPVNFGFLDFSTLEKRKIYCEKEVELNRRFSEGIYIGVFPIIEVGQEHKIAATSDAENENVVDYAVKMYKIPNELFLKHKIEHEGVSSEELIKIGKTISNYHDKAKTNPDILKFGSIAVVKQNTNENFEQTEKYVGKSLSRDQFKALKNWTDAFYETNPNIFQERVENAKIKDCHGDLHTEHVVLTDPISLIDCIEFNKRFRYGDILSDLAFLLMDLEYNEKWKYAETIKIVYLKQACEQNVEGLIKFYKVYRAYVRGKVTSFQLDNPELSEEKIQDISQQAGKYFDLAVKYIE